MPITDELINLAVARYFRERDRYRKLAEAVEQKVRRVVEYNAIRATVQSRAKEPESLRGKLQRFAGKVDKEQQIQTVDDVFTHVGDLAAVRVSTYIDDDRERVVNLLMGEFVNAAGERLGTAPGDIEVKPPPLGSPSGKSSPNYRATHCLAYLPDSELKGAYENLRRTPCEIQVCSLLAHVWNEIEHDLGYKPHGGELSVEEKDCLAELAAKTREGDKIIARLVGASEEKLKVSADPFKSVDDFYARLKDIVPLSPEPRQALSELYYEMVRYGLSSPRAINDKLLTGNWLERGDMLILQLNILGLTKSIDFSEAVKSYDILAILFLKEFGDQIVAQHRKNRIPPTRLSKLATRVKEIK